MRVGDQVCFRGKRPGTGLIEVMYGRVTDAWVESFKATNDGSIAYLSITNDYGSWTKPAAYVWMPDAVTRLGDVIRDSD